MTLRKTLTGALALGAAAAATVSAAGAGAEYEMDMGAALRECSILVEEERGYVSVCWLPAEFWAYKLSQEEEVPDGIVDHVYRIFNRHIIIAVVAVSIEGHSKLEFASREEISETIRLRDRYGTFYEPVTPGDRDLLVVFLNAVWEMILAPQFGAMGGGMNIFIFPAEDAQGRTIANPAEEGTFALLVGEHEFVWQLPLSSFLRPKICPMCGRELSGAYKFCPYDGTELVGQIVEIPSEVAE